MSYPGERHGIVVAVDGSAASDSAVRWAADEAVMRDEPVTLVHVVAPVVVNWPVMPLEASITEWAQDNADHVIEQAQKTFLASVGEGRPPALRTAVHYANVVTTLIDATEHARIMVTGSRGMGTVGRALIGSVSSGLIHHARCPVAVIHADDGHSATAPILLGIDGSPASEKATALAFDEASRRGVGLVALHAWSDVGVFPIVGMDWHQYEDAGHEVLAERLAGWQERYPDVRVRRQLVCDRPAHWLIDESPRAQLVVVGSRGRGGFTGMLLGSVSSAVAQMAKAPVIVVRDHSGS